MDPLLKVSSISHLSLKWPVRSAAGDLFIYSTIKKKFLRDIGYSDTRIRGWLWYNLPRSRITLGFDNEAPAVSVLSAKFL